MESVTSNKSTAISDFLKPSSSNVDSAIFDDDVDEIISSIANTSLKNDNPSKVPIGTPKSKPDEFVSTISPIGKGIQPTKESSPPAVHERHVCPHKTANPNDQFDRNSPYPMIEVVKAQEIIFNKINSISESKTFISPLQCPPFRASLKDGYAMKSTSSSKVRKVIGFISAGDAIIKTDFGADECYKINTGAPLPDKSDCILQIEDTKLIKTAANGSELEIEVLKMPMKRQDVRSAGADLRKGEVMFSKNGILGVAEKTLLASVGLSHIQKLPKIAVISTGDELVDPTSGELTEGKIYDSNTTMLKLLCQKYGFDVKFAKIAKDDYASLKSVIQAAMNECQVIISSGGVSMGDKDFVKPLLKDLGYMIHFGRVNVKPGKPMTFATNPAGTSFFGLPGNPVSSFVCFHIFVLPALRHMCGFSQTKSVLPSISVILQDPKYELDPRPEYVRATVSYNNKTGHYAAQITSNQLSSRLASLIDADVLLHLPAKSEVQNGFIGKGWKLRASVIDQFFVSGAVE